MFAAWAIEHPEQRNYQTYNGLQFETMATLLYNNLNKYLLCQQVYLKLVVWAYKEEEPIRVAVFVPATRDGIRNLVMEEVAVQLLGLSHGLEVGLEDLAIGAKNKSQTLSISLLLQSCHRTSLILFIFFFKDG